MVMVSDSMEDGKRLARRILGVLRDRHAMHIGELCLRLESGGASIRTALEEMMARGEVERLRSLGHTGEDSDYFRVKRPAAVMKGMDDRWVRLAGLAGRDHMRLAGEAMACFAD